MISYDQFIAQQSEIMQLVIRAICAEIRQHCNAYTFRYIILYIYGHDYNWWLIVCRISTYLCLGRHRSRCCSARLPIDSMWCHLHGLCDHHREPIQLVIIHEGKYIIGPIDHMVHNIYTCMQRYAIFIMSVTCLGIIICTSCSPLRILHSS
jgi:hypothetical protein